MKRCLRRMFIGCAALAAAFAASNAKPPKQAAPAAGPQAVISSIWNKLLARCGDSYFYSGSVFDGQGMLSDLGAGKNPTLITFKTVKFNTVQVRISDAERMNGLEGHARITMMAHLYRVNDGSWEDGPDFRPRNTNDIFGKVLQDVAGDSGELGLGGAMAFDLMKVKGIWAIGRSSTSMSGPLTFHTNYYDVQKLVGARVSRYSCQQAKVLPPPPTAEEVAAQREAERAAREKAEQEAKQKAEEEQRQADQERREAEARADLKRRMAPWSFAGGVPEFKLALLAKLQTRAQEFGVDPNAYKNEIDDIMKIVAVCTAITPAEYNAVVSSTGNYRVRREMLHGCDGAATDISVWGTLISPKGKPRGISVSRTITEYDSDRHDFVMAVYFKITLRFMPVQPEDKAKRPMNLIEDIDPTYDIISAKIPFSPSYP